MSTQAHDFLDCEIDDCEQCNDHMIAMNKQAQEKLTTHYSEDTAEAAKFWLKDGNIEEEFVFAEGVTADDCEFFSHPERSFAWVARMPKPNDVGDDLIVIYLPTEEDPFGDCELGVSEFNFVG